MLIHTIPVSVETATILYRACPTDKRLLGFEGDILAYWAVRWDSAGPHKRRKMLDNLRLTLGVDNASSD